MWHTCRDGEGWMDVVQWLKERLMWLGNVGSHLKNGEMLLLYLPIYMKACRAECGIYKSEHGGKDLCEGGL